MLHKIKTCIRCSIPCVVFKIHPLLCHPDLEILWDNAFQDMSYIFHQNADSHG